MTAEKSLVFWREIAIPRGGGEEWAGVDLPGNVQGERWDTTAQKMCTCEILLMPACFPLTEG